MTAKVSPLDNFRAKRNVEAPISGATANPVSKPAPKEKAVEAEPQVPVGFRMTESGRWELRQYAASLNKTVQTVLTEALALHRAKHDKR